MVAEVGVQRREPRVLVSYAHESTAHEQLVLGFYEFLRSVGVNARIDVLADQKPQRWNDWMTAELRAADFVAIIASAEYRRRADGDAALDEGRGVQHEADFLKDRFYVDREDSRRRFLPVVLPGCSPRDIPSFLSPVSGSHYTVSAFTVHGAEKLLRYLFDDPAYVEPPLGARPVIGANDAGITTDRLGIPTEAQLDERTAARDPSASEALAHSISISVEWPDNTVRTLDHLRDDELYWVVYVSNYGNLPVHNVLVTVGSGCRDINMGPSNPGRPTWFILRYEDGFQFDPKGQRPAISARFTALGHRWRLENGALQPLSLEV